MRRCDAAFFKTSRTRHPSRVPERFFVKLMRKFLQKLIWEKFGRVQ